ncbi:MAG: response regulator [Bacteroidales bacterium]|nr:response regulator [Bacteroidales bacterium]
MHANNQHTGIFANIPDYGFMVNPKGIIEDFTQQAENIFAHTSNLRGLKIQSLFPSIKRKSIQRLHDFEFDYHVKKQTLRFRINVKQLDSTKNEQYIVWLKDITTEHRQERVNRILMNISQLELVSEDINQFYTTIQSELNTLFDANNLYIVLFDKYKVSLNLAFISDTHNIQQPYPQGNTLALWIAQTAKAVILSQKQINQLKKIHNLDLFGPKALCWMGVPLKIKHDIIGVIALQNYNSTDAFTPEDLDVLKFISTQIATSIQHKENELALRQAKEKAVESDRLKSAFLANMSHEIRTPMNAILGFAELVSRQNIQPEKREVYTQHIVNNGKILLNLVDDIIDLAKIEAGQLKFRRNTTNISELLAELLETSIAEKKRLKKNDIQITCNPDNRNTTQWLLCDNLRLKQVMLNLLSNALKFTFGGSIEFGYTIPNNATIQFYVKDSGIGILPEQQSIIFERFRQADDTATRQFGGTGLGLAISKKLVELMGGRIWVTSEPHVGSTFYFTQPLIIPDLTNNHPLAETPSQTPQLIHSNKAALVVEDNEANYIFLYELLHQTGIKVIRANNGLEAVGYIQNNPNTHLILMDLQLPELDGFEATKRIKRIAPSIPIIAQTAFALSDEKNKAMSAGCDYYLTKPIAAKKLLNLIETILSDA